VAAYRDPPLRKPGRWARRHRPLVAGAAALLASSVVGLAVGALLINQERARAESNFRRARAAVDEYFTTVSESKLLDVPGLQPLRKELLESARRYYEDFLNERGEDPSVAAEAAAAAFRVASVTALLGDLAGASENYRRAIALYETLVASRPGDVDLRSDLSMCYSSLGLLLDGMERDDEGVVEVRRALEIRERLAREHPENGHFQADLARSHRHLGDFHRQVGEFAQAEEHWRKGLAIQEDLLAHPPPRDPTRHHLTRRGDVETVVREDLADILFDLSGILRELGRWDESLVFGRRGRDLLEAMLRDRPGDAELMAQLAGGYTNLALTTLNRGSAEGSHELGAKAIALLEKVVAANPSVENYRGRLADAHLTSGYALERLGRAESATREYRLATELAEGLLASDATSVFAMSLTAQGLLYQSRMLINAGRLDDALPKLRRAQALQEEIVRRHPKVVFYRFNLAFVCRALGRAEERYGRPADAFSAFDRARRLDAIEADQIFIGRYNEACDEALMARVAPPERREALVGQALATLRRAVAQGYRSYAELANDADLSALRGRPELDLLLLELAFPDDPFSGAP
jgi:tetratricopeptide (TPR) repeat protein